MLRRSLLALIAALALPASAHADPVIDERFDGGALPAGWTPVEGEWSVAGGRLVGRSTSAGQLSRLTFGPHLDNYRFEVTLRFDSVIDGSALDRPGARHAGRWRAAVVAGGAALEHDRAQRAGVRPAHGGQRLERARDRRRALGRGGRA